MARHEWIEIPRVLTTGRPYKWRCSGCGVLRVLSSLHGGRKRSSYRYYAEHGPYIADKIGTCAGRSQAAEKRSNAK
jgi:hypothetical protein